MRTQTLNEGRNINLVRNALLVAGHEMGEDGDHWPVIKSSIHQMMRDWEELQIERNVQAQLKINIEDTIKELRSIHQDSPDSFKPEIESAIKELTELHDAAFGAVNENDVTINAEDMPNYMPRIEAIVATLEDDHA